jgi:hypothetical protein
MIPVNQDEYRSAPVLPVLFIVVPNHLASSISIYTDAPIAFKRINSYGRCRPVKNPELESLFI